MIPGFLALRNANRFWSTDQVINRAIQESRMFSITRSGDPTNPGAMKRPFNSFAAYRLRITQFASVMTESLSFAGFPARSEMSPLLQNPLLFCEKSPSRNCCIPRQLAGDVYTYPPRPTGSLREILGQPGQSCPKTPKLE